MFTPKYPAPDTAIPAARPPTAVTTSAVPAQVSAPLPTRPLSPRVVQLTPGALVGVAAGGTAVILVVGAVLVSMLLAVAVTATSLAICAVVLRSLLTQPGQHR
ncbi:SpdD protein [Streptomyces lichenis]|uniref:SpdD protein n=1 Tax=Streptomyces lichenis TaxID=2306967 RepID=A0ABT0IG26_9ACTN|nr:SpdD protein [Streptomyces lichenis]MCK8680220.1 SpdD protein [Streptomyces lichenis]